MGNAKTRTKFGRFMYDVITKASLYVAHHKPLFYFLSYTWGILTTIIGWIVIGFVNLFMRKEIIEKGKFFTAHYAMIGSGWGGIELGSNFLLSNCFSDKYNTHVKCHELGHTYQNAVLGPFAIILVAIPSVIRYWIQTIREARGLWNEPYDLFWAEASASKIGETLLSEKEGKNLFYYTWYGEYEDDYFERNENYGESYGNNESECTKQEMEQEN